MSYDRMPFGKYKGTEIKRVPTDYLEWCLATVDFKKPELKKAIHDEFMNRLQPDDFSFPGFGPEPDFGSDDGIPFQEVMMKKAKYYVKPKDGSKVLHFSFLCQIKLIPRLYKLEMEQMRHRMMLQCTINGWNHLDLVKYMELEEDRRHDKTIPRGYRKFRYGYTLRTNIAPRERIGVW